MIKWNCLVAFQSQQASVRVVAGFDRVCDNSATLARFSATKMPRAAHFAFAIACDPIVKALPNEASVKRLIEVRLEFKTTALIFALTDGAARTRDGRIPHSKHLHYIFTDTHNEFQFEHLQYPVEENLLSATLKTHY